MERYRPDTSPDAPLERSILVFAIALLLIEPIAICLGGPSASISRLVIGGIAKVRP